MKKTLILGILVLSALSFGADTTTTAPATTPSCPMMKDGKMMNHETMMKDGKMNHGTMNHGTMNNGTKTAQ